MHIGSSLGSPSSDVEPSLSSDVSADLLRLRAARTARSAIETVWSGAEKKPEALEVFEVATRKIRHRY